MDIYPVDIYNNADNFLSSTIYEGKSDVDDLSGSEYLIIRDIGLRYLIYHEMTHVLQKAVDTVNSDDKRTSKSSRLSAYKSMYRISDRYNIDWGDDYTLNESNNRIINNKSQADGIALEMIRRTYGLSDIQNRLMWEYLINRLEKAKLSWEYSMDYFEQEQEGYDMPRIAVSAFAYHLPQAGTPVPNHEVRSAFWFPLADLRAPERQIDHRWPAGAASPFPGILVGASERHVLWGLTYRFLEVFFGRVALPLPDRWLEEHRQHGTHDVAAEGRIE